MRRQRLTMGEMSEFAAQGSGNAEFGRRRRRRRGGKKRSKLGLAAKIGGAAAVAGTGYALRNNKSVRTGLGKIRNQGRKVRRAAPIQGPGF